MDLLLTLAAALALFSSGCARQEAPSASVGELFAELDSGHLLARRRALSALADAFPTTGAEMDRLLQAVRQDERRRLKKAALSALNNAPGTFPALEPYCGRMLEDGLEEVRLAGLQLCRRLGLKDSDPRLARFFERYPSAVSVAPESLSPYDYARLRSWADRVEGAAAGVDAGGLARAAVLAEKADAEGFLRLLDDRAFTAGGLMAGRDAARAGRKILPRAEELLKGQDPLARETALGILLYMRDREAAGDLRRIANGPDKEAASCAEDALAAMAKGE